MPTNREAYALIKKALHSAGFPEAEAEAREIVCHYARCGYTELFFRFDDKAQFSAEYIISERLKGKPVAYILNEKYFYGLSFYVDERVLIPRYDTEILVHEAVGIIKKTSAEKVLDICCGSGCIGITLAKNTDIKLVMSDISRGAAEVAAINAERHGVKNIKIVISDLFEKITGEFDVITANPPYVTEDEYSALESQVKDFEPKSALLGGTAYYRRIADEARAHLAPGGHIIAEIGCFQAEAVSDIFASGGYENVRCIKDIAQRDRVIICTKSWKK